jgi:uncharacterized heparinase superfamily protein
MADRSILRFDTAPMHGGQAPLWVNLITRFLPSPHLKARSFGQVIARLAPGDEAQAFAMYAGQFTFAGETISCTTPEVFSKSHGSKEWQRNLKNLSWLQHLAASNRNLHAHFAMRLLGRWAKAGKKPRDAKSLALIVLSLTIDGQVLARRCEPQLQTEFMEIVSRATKQLLHKTARDAETAIIKAIALLHVATAFKGFDGLRKQTLDTLNANIDKIILPDGGHISRDASKLVKLLALLLPLKAAMKADRQLFQLQALERMLPMLTMLCHGDGGLTSLHGNEPYHDVVKAILLHDEVRAKPLSIAPHAGFARVTQGSACLLADTRQRFEIDFSDGPQRLFRNAVITSDHASSAQLRQSSQGSLLQMTRSDGHERTCFLSGDGTDLRVEDIHPGSLEVIFEIHPDVKLSALREGGIMLVTPDRSVWILSLRGGEAHTEQNGALIKISSPGEGCLNWALKKQSKIAKPKMRKSSREPDFLG